MTGGTPMTQETTKWFIMANPMVSLFIRENTIKMDDDWGYLNSWKHPYMNLLFPQRLGGFYSSGGRLEGGLRSPCGSVGLAENHYVHR